MRTSLPAHSTKSRRILPLRLARHGFPRRGTSLFGSRVAGWKRPHGSSPLSRQCWTLAVLLAAKLFPGLPPTGALCPPPFLAWHALVVLFSSISLFSPDECCFRRSAPNKHHPLPFPPPSAFSSRPNARCIADLAPNVFRAASSTIALPSFVVQERLFSSIVALFSFSPEAFEDTTWLAVFFYVSAAIFFPLPMAVVEKSRFLARPAWWSPVRQTVFSLWRTSPFLFVSSISLLPLGVGE